MATVEFFDSFDGYGNAATMGIKWDAGANPSFVTGRFGGSGVASSGGVAGTATLGAAATRCMGFAYRNTNASTAGIIVNFLDAGTTQCELRYVATGALTVTRNGTVLGTSAAGLILLNVWYYIEFKVTIDNAGTYEVRINGTNVLSGSGDTQNTANAFATQVNIPAVASGAYQYDDFFVADTFIGECRVFLSVPTGDSATNAQWTPSTGTSHFAMVDEIPPNGDTDYNLSATPGQIDTFTKAAIAPTGSIVAVQVNIDARKDDVGVRQISDEIRTGGANFVGATVFTITSSYHYYTQIHAVNPGTGNPWTLSEVNAAEFGYNLVA